MAKVIITGVAGFIGSHTAKKFLENGISVIGIDDYSCGFGHNTDDLFAYDNFTFIKKDIRDNIDIQDEVDAVYHFAARGDIPFCMQQPRAAIDINVFGTINILDLAIKCKAKHFYFSDTCAEYDGLIDDEYYPLQEIYAPSSLSPLSSYGITKMAAAQFVRSYSTQFDIGCTIFRYTNIYGPSMNLTREVPPVIGGFASKILKQQPAIIYGDGSKTRDFLYIDDLTNLHYISYQKRLYDKDIITYNIGAGKSISIKDLYSLVYDVCLSLRGNLLPEESVNHLPPRDNEAQNIIIDNSIVCSDLGWEPQISIKAGVIKTVQYIYEQQRGFLISDKNKKALRRYRRIKNG